MSWDFETDPEFEDKLAWASEFCRNEVEPLDYVVESPYDLDDPVRKELFPPLQAKVREQGLWACHLGPELGGPGYGQVKLALLNEILGRSRSAPLVFGCQPPDSGNAEILAHFGTPDLKRRYLEPLLENRIVSAFSMTEPQAGADPLEFVGRADLDGEHWVINGEKWFTTEARYASFFIVMAVTDPEGEPHRRFSMFVVPRDTPGVEIVRNVGLGDEPIGTGEHAYMRYTDVRIPADHLLGARGAGFAVAQTRLGGGRIHHCMRTVGLVGRAFDMMCERALSRRTRGEVLGDKQMVQQMIADSWIEIEQYRLLVLRTAWRIDKYNDYKRVRHDIAAVKSAMPTVLREVAQRALQVHGSLGVSNEMPFVRMIVEAATMGLVDGPTEVHKVTLAKQVLRQHEPSPGLFPTEHIPAARAAAFEKFADTLARHGRAPGKERVEHRD